MSDDIFKGLRGRTKAAILLGFLPTDLAKKIIGYLDVLEREILIKEVTTVPSYPEEVIRAVLMEYMRHLRGTNGMFKSGKEHARDLLKDLMDPGELGQMMDRISLNTIRPFESLKRLKDVGPLLSFLSNEDPQTIAVVVSHMKPTQGAELLQALPEDKMVEVSMAIANMDQTNREVLVRIEKHLSGKLENILDDDSSATDGVKTLVDILNNATRSTEKVLFEKLEVIDAKLTQTIKDSMFVFEDIIALDRMAVQVVINKIPNNELIAKALKTASEELKECFYGAMPEKRKAIILEEMENLRAVKKSDVEESQQQIANIVKELDKDGHITIARGEDDVIL